MEMDGKEVPWPLRLLQSNLRIVLAQAFFACLVNLVSAVPANLPQLERSGENGPGCGVLVVAHPYLLRQESRRYREEMEAKVAESRQPPRFRGLAGTGAKGEVSHQPPEFRLLEEREARAGVNHRLLEFRPPEEREAKVAESRQPQEFYLHCTCHYRFLAVG